MDAVVVFLSIPLASLLLAAAPVVVRPHLAVEPADLHGVVLFSDGVTPVTRLGVRVWDSENERSIYRTQTTDEGIFSIPRLGDGRYFLIVGELSIDMEVFAAEATDNLQQSHDIVIVIPRRVLIGTPGFQDSTLLLGPLLPTGGSSTEVVPLVPTPDPPDPTPPFLTPFTNTPPPDRVTSP